MADTRTVFIINTVVFDLFKSLYIYVCLCVYAWYVHMYYGCIDSMHVCGGQMTTLNIGPCLILLETLSLLLFIAMNDKVPDP